MLSNMHLFLTHSSLRMLALMQTELCSACLFAVQDRVAKLQELYMRDLDQSKAITVHDSIQQSNLLQLATPEMLAVSQPPPSFPVPQTAKAFAVVPALHEIETLRRERGSLKEQVRSQCRLFHSTFQSIGHLSSFPCL